MSTNIIHLQDRLRRPLTIRAEAYRVEELPEYSLAYLVGVTPEQLAAALRCSSLIVQTEHGETVVKQQPEPPEAA